MLQKEYRIAGGSVRGNIHALGGTNNQDSFSWFSTKQHVIAVVCDGCSRSAYSEAGARIGAQMIAAGLHRYGERLHNDPLRYLERVCLDVLAGLRVLANQMGDSLSSIVRDYFLFTVMGAAITPTHTLIFSIGDGVYALNGDVAQIGPFPGNEPPYLGYDLLDEQTQDVDQLRFQIQKLLPTGNMRTLLIGSDGVGDLIAKAERRIPGKKDVVGPISRFWEQDRYFNNPDAIRRELQTINREIIRYVRDDSDRIIDIIVEEPLLPDDTTLIAIRANDSA